MNSLRRTHKQGSRNGVFVDCRGGGGGLIWVGGGGLILFSCLYFKFLFYFVFVVFFSFFWRSKINKKSRQKDVIGFVTVTSLVNI